ncbi:hypothetical protein MTR_3g466770 [Medicago truncatula]|uniref:Uncharacterized protein n=1 Tax=Medicago truncatula TaxID=3880 RepID=A0A072UXD5_MEDTR|nr:hypothetical protein MTR_3g466770 [Medicago truncatula]
MGSIIIGNKVVDDAYGFLNVVEEVGYGMCIKHNDFCAGQWKPDRRVSTRERIKTFKQISRSNQTFIRSYSDLKSKIMIGWIREGSFTNDCPKFGERIWTVKSFFFFTNGFWILYRTDALQDTNFAPTCKVLKSVFGWGNVLREFNYFEGWAPLKELGSS